MAAENPLILLVEDNPSIYKLILYKLKGSGFRTEHRDNGPDGLQAVRELRPDLVVLDVMLPGMNGFELLREVREDEREAVRETKVIMLTTKNREEDLEQGFDLQVEDYMGKPFKPAELLMRIQKILD